MEGNAPDTQGFRFADSRQQRIYRELQDIVGPGPAAFFRDACWMMDNPHRLLTTAHLTAHCLREVEEQIRFLFQPLSCGGSRKEQINSIVSLTDLSREEKERLRVLWEDVAAQLPRFAHKQGVHAIRRVQEMQDLWNQCLLLLDVVLKVIRDNYLKWLSPLDKLIEQSKHSAPTEADLKALTHYVPWSFVTGRHFFDRLENSEWLKPLWDKGFFRHPPAPIKDEEGNIRLLPWPETRYLARMAHHKPELVAEIIQKMDDTDNAAVLADLVDALLVMPLEVPARLAEKVVRWAERPYWLLPEKLGEIIAHWAKGGHTGEALQVASVLLEVLPDERRAEPGPTGAYRLPEPRARFDSWEYRRILQEHYPELVKATGLRALELLGDLLEKAIHLSRRDANDPETQDYSCLWRPVVEDHPQNLANTIRYALVSAVRDAADLIVRSGSATVEEVVYALERRRWKVFRRIALYLLGVFPDRAEALAAERLTDRALFDDVDLRHEYTLLLRARFPRLSPQDQATILGWIEAGPDIEDLQREEKEAPSEVETTRHREIWQRDWLARISPENLPAEWREHYDELTRRYGEPEHPEFPVYVECRWIEPTSPRTADELKAMSVEEIVEFLRSWTPPETFWGEPSPEGLGRVLSSVVAEDPGRFALQATLFRGLDPTYVRAAVSGFKGACGQNKVFQWQPVLDLCQWVISQPHAISGRQLRGTKADPDWGWTRTEIADLVSVGLEDRPAGIPFELREKVWGVLKPLTEDPEPTPEYERRYGGANMDPFTLSLNTTRGRAMHAAVRYALWVRRHLGQKPGSEHRLQRGLEEMPEVREVLEAHLDPAREPSLAIRAVYGQWFPQLAVLDPEWARSHARAIFPLDRESKPFFEAAWNAYVVFCRLYDNLLEILRPQYEQAVNRIGSRRDPTDSLPNPDERLAEHLMDFYWRGNLPPEDPLLVSFWEKAPDSVRSHALKFAGSELTQRKVDRPEEVLDRLRRLWEVRLAAAKKAQQPSDFEKEMTAFGWWFVSGKFDVDWSLEQLLHSLRLSRRVEPTHMVLEYLAVTAKLDPRKSIECLMAIVEGDRGSWQLRASRDHVWSILQTALEAQDCRREAEKLIHYLGSLGFVEYGDLLKR